MNICLDIYQSAAIGVLALLIGRFCNTIFPSLKKICIPTPVTGGICVSLLILFLYLVFDIRTSFDDTVKNICMTLFFASVGFMSDFSTLKKGGKPLAILVIMVFILIILQNIAGISIAKLLNQNNLLGIACGSVSMCGGHGTSAGFADTLQQMGLTGASTLTMTAATFGIIAGAAIGGPLSAGLIYRFKLAKSKSNEDVSEIASEMNSDPVIRDIESDRYTVADILKASFILVLSAGLGTLINMLLNRLGINLPSYFGALLIAVIIRNTFPIFCDVKKLNVSSITSIGKITLELFLGIAMASLKLWELAGFALPMGIILISQVLILLIFARYIAFPLLGKNYNAAVLVSGLCGFGLGATPNAMANMTAVCKKYHYCSQPFIIIPLVGAVFLDIMNIAVLTVFLNIL